MGPRKKKFKSTRQFDLDNFDLDDFEESDSSSSVDSSDSDIFKPKKKSVLDSSDDEKDIGMKRD